MERTQRQRRWRYAAERATREGNAFGAALFTLIAQPNEEERHERAVEEMERARREARRQQS